MDNVPLGYIAVSCPCEFVDNYYKQIRIPTAMSISSTKVVNFLQTPSFRIEDNPLGIFQLPAEIRLHVVSARPPSLKSQFGREKIMVAFFKPFLDIALVIWHRAISPLASTSSINWSPIASRCSISLGVYTIGCNRNMIIRVLYQEYLPLRTCQPAFYPYLL